MEKIIAKLRYTGAGFNSVMLFFIFTAQLFFNNLNLFCVDGKSLACSVGGEFFSKKCSLRIYFPDDSWKIGILICFCEIDFQK